MCSGHSFGEQYFGSKAPCELFVLTHLTLFGDSLYRLFEKNLIFTAVSLGENRITVIIIVP